ncbi:hypothetical protein B0A55_10754 [Friedmanniomyces simplex]|uniref:Uncharacterized protein n=1 Tax=Friedmanniomyces simplex TaxID=329884 RepID=A0A4U0WJ75_9PEZI|nr:hypothetical protein B0A55_10754 [Friedmanniomyces simplex]
MSSESSNASDPSSLDLNRLSLSPGSSAGTAITEPDQAVEVPTELESRNTLLFFGLSSERAASIWQRWKTINEDSYRGDFGTFTREFLRSHVQSAGCDTGEPDTDWSLNLRQIGVDERLINVIARSGAWYNGIRLTKSAAEWVDLAIEWKWEWLLYINKASNKRAEGGIDMPPNVSPIQVRMLTIPQVDEEDVTKVKYDRKNDSVVDANGKPLDYIPLWRGTSRVRAEGMWALPMRRGNFDIKNQLCNPPTDFSAKRAAHHWTPDLEGAQMYASFAEKIAEPAGFCLVRIEVPLALLKKQSDMFLRSPDEQWKKVVWYSRSQEKMPKELQRTLMKKSLLIGDTATGIDRKYHQTADWSKVDEKCRLKLRSGTPVTQYVFGLRDDEDDDIDLEQINNKQSDRTSIRMVDKPNIKLPPMETEAQKKAAAEETAGKSC